MSRKRLVKDIKNLFQLWTDKSIFNEKLRVGWLATLKIDKHSYLTYRDELDDESKNQLEAALARRLKALEAVDSEVLERRCRMNGLPRVQALMPSSADLDSGRGETRVVTREQMVRTILACEEFKMRNYVKMAEREMAKK